MSRSFRDRLRAPEGDVDVTTIETDATPGVHGKADAASVGDELAELQERLFAEGTVEGATRRILLVLQGMDTSGKGGTLRHVVGLVDPLGCQITSFKKPTPDELSHHFLWRIRRAVPRAGRIGVFDRSHYEDVLVVRVHDFVPPEIWEGRYEEINAFERELVADGVTIVKCYLHISYEEQRARLLERLERPDKHWKFNPGDLDERALWPKYMEAYSAAIARCSTPEAPWYVIPADKKWYRDYAIAGLLLETLRELDPQFPQHPEFDVAALRKRLLAD